MYFKTGEKIPRWGEKILPMQVYNVGAPFERI